jgi:hypothetical protein
MSSQNRSKDHRKLTARIACGAILVAGLAAGSHWHRAAKATGASTVQTTLTSSAQAVQSSFATLPLPQPISHVSKYRSAHESTTTPTGPASVYSSAISPEVRAQAIKTYAALPLRFEANQGQTDPRVKFLSHGQGYTLFLTQNEAVLSVMEPAKDTEPAQTGRPNSATKSRRETATLRVKFSGAAGTAKATGKDLLGSQTNYFLGNDPKKWHTGVPNYAAVEYRGLYPGIDAVFHGNRQQFEFDFDVAPGADLSKAELEMEGSAKPRLDAEGNIVLSLADKTEVTLDKPKIYQEIAGQRREVTGSFVVRNGNRIGFSVGDYDRSLPLVIDPTFTLQYSTYIGGVSPGVDTISGVAIGPSNNATYLVGTTDSTKFPTTTPQIPASNAYQSTCETCSENAFDSAFVAKFDQHQNLMYYTYLGPEANSSVMPDEIGEAYGYAISVDALGVAYITGQTTSQYFPTTANGLTFPTSGQPAFITELSDVVNIAGEPQQQQLLNSTFLGGSGRDQGNSIALDNQGNIYVVGTTSSKGLNTAGAIQSTFTGEYATFLAQINFNNSTTSILNYYTYLMGSALDAGTAVAVDASGDVWVGGYTMDTTPPVATVMGQSTIPADVNPPPPATPTDKDEYAGFVAKLNITPTYSSSLLYFSYLGATDITDTGINGTQILALALDSAGNAYATGTTNEPDLVTTSGAIGGGIGATPTVCVGSGKNACPQGFVAEFNPNVSGTPLQLLTYFGGLTPPPPIPFSPITTGTGIAVDQWGDIFVTGSVTTENFPEPTLTPGAATNYQAYGTGTLPCAANIAKSLACESAFLVEFSPGASVVLYSTYLGGASGGSGGSTKDFATGIALDSSSNVYLVGNETSSSFPTNAAETPLIGTAPSTGEHGFFSVFEFPSGPLLKVSPPIANFGSTPPGQSVPSITLIVWNGGSGDLVIQSVTPTTGPFSVSAVPVSCSGGVPPGAVCYPVSFTPASGQATGPTFGTITFVDNAPQGVPDPVYASEYDQTYNLEVSYGTAPTLVSIAVSPSNSSITVGGTQQFGAMGTFSDGSVQNPLNSVAWSVPAANNAATISLGGLATGQNAGTTTISASQSGVTGTANLTVTQATTTTSLVISPTNSASYGQAVTLTATVTSNGSPVTSGTVTFTDGSTTLTGTAQLGTNGTATFMTSSLPLGLQSLSASYNVTPNFASSPSQSINLTVTQATTTTTLAVSPTGSAAYGQLVTLTAAVTPNSSGISSGSVTFYDGTNVLQSGVALNSSGQAIYATAALSVGSHSLSAMYTGTVDYLSSNSTSSTGPVILAIPAPVTITTLSSSPTGTVTSGTQVILSANVTSAGLPVQGVTVNFLSGTTSLGTGTSPTDVNGNATYTSSTFSAGTYSFTASCCAGSLNYATSTSAAVALTVTAPSSTATYTANIYFPDTLTNGTSTQAVWVQNDSQSPFTLISATSATANSPFSVLPGTSASNCPALPAIIAPNSSCLLPLQFAPTTTGLQTGTLLVVDNAISSNVASEGPSGGGTLRSIPLFGNAAAVLGHGQLTTIAGSTAPPGGTCTTPGWVFISDPQCAQPGAGGLLSGPTCLTSAGPVPLCDNGSNGYPGPATVAQLYFPAAVAVGPGGTVYIADSRNGAVRAIDPSSGTITTYATDPTTNVPVTAVAADSAGNVYYGDQLGFIFKNGSQFQPGGSGLSIAALTTDTSNNLYVLATVSGSFETITMYTPQGTSILFADTSQDIPSGFLGASLSGLAVDSSGCSPSATTCNVYTYWSSANGSFSNQIVELSFSTGSGNLTATAASPSGLFSGAGVSFVPVSNLTMDSSGNFYMLTNQGTLLQEYQPTTATTGVLIDLAGTGIDGYNNPYNPLPPFTLVANYDFDGPFPATQTDLNQAPGLAIDQSGAVYIADDGNNLVRKFVNQPIALQIVWPSPSPIIYGTALSGTQLDATLSPNLPAIAGTFVYTPAAGVVLPVGQQTLSVTFTPADTADFSTVTATTTLTVFNTSSGADVTVMPVDTTTNTTPVTLTFANVTEPGVTSLTTSSTGPAAPFGFQQGSPLVYYNLSTTATYTGSITICINYAGVTFTSLPPQLFHYTGGAWVLLPVVATTAPTTVCGTTTSLSPFALFQPTASPTTTAISAAGVIYGTPASVTVSATSAGGTVTGSMSLSVDGGTASTMALTNGSAVFNLGVLSAATHTLSASFAAQGNFLASSVVGAISVAQAPLTIAANNATRVYGAANPSFTATSSGFVKGDNASMLIGILSCSTAATPASPVGTYPVTCSGQSAANYSITYVPGQLSVTPAPLTITANNVSRPYGQANPSSFGVTYSGFVNGDTSSSLSGALSCTTTAVQSSPVGTYPITCTGLTSSNYAITFVPGTLTVIKEVLSITAKFVSIAQASSGNYVVTIAVTNNGDITANKISSGIMIGNLVIPGGSLGDKADISSAPALDVAPGATADITLVFPASAGKPSTTRELLAYGFATATNPNATPVLPALWVLQPAPTQVTLP